MSTALASGPKGAFRAFQATQAVAGIAQEYVSGLQRGVQEPPQVGTQRDS